MNKTQQDTEMDITFEELSQTYVNSRITREHEPTACETPKAPFINDDGSFDPDIADMYYN